MTRLELPPAFLAVPLAHRALHDARDGVIENSLSAVRRAVAARYGIEIDVQLTADGAAVMFHDETLDRVTSASGTVRDRSAADLATIHLGGGGDTIPALSEVLAVVEGRVPLLIEIKDQSGGAGDAVEPVLERAVAAALTGYGGPVAVMSFNPNMVAAMAALAPDIPRGLTTCGFGAEDWPDLTDEHRRQLRDISAFDAVGAAFVSHDWHDLDNPAVTDLKRRGVPILCWTVKSPEAEVQARRVADTITFEGYVPGAASEPGD